MNFFKFLVLSSLAAVTAAAPAYCEEDEEGSGKVFNSIKKAITEKDRDLFVRTLRYPFETCFKNENKRFLNPGELEGYSLADLLGSEALLDAYIKEIAGRASGEYFELAYDNEQVAGVFASVGDNESSFINYTSKGIYKINKTNCQAKMPKLEFCHNTLMDAQIRMFAMNSFWEFNDGTFENFTDHKYSKIDYEPGEIKIFDTVKFTLDGKEIEAKRDPRSFNDAPVYTSGTSQYMILAPQDPNRIYCYAEGICTPVSYVHIYAKDGPDGACEHVVLPEKYTLNFCPKNRLHSSEIRLYTEGFSLRDKFWDDFSSVYTSADGAYSFGIEEKMVTFDNKVLPPAEVNGEDSIKKSVAVLRFGGQEYYYVEKFEGSISFKVGDREILALPEGDYDAIPDNTTGKYGCMEGFDCARNTSRVVLFARNSDGICDRIVLTGKSGK